MNGGKSAANRVAFLLSLREVREVRPGSVPRCVIDDVLEVARLIWQRLQQAAVGDRHPGPGDARRSGGRRGLRGPPGGRRSRHSAGDGRGARGAGGLRRGDLCERIMLAARARGVGSAIGWFVGGVSAAKHLLGTPEGRRSGPQFFGVTRRKMCAEDRARRANRSRRSSTRSVMVPSIVAPSVPVFYVPLYA
jgi:hypothetical protein